MSPFILFTGVGCFLTGDLALLFVLESTSLGLLAEGLRGEFLGCKSASTIFDFFGLATPLPVTYTHKFKSLVKSF